MRSRGVGCFLVMSAPRAGLSLSACPLVELPFQYSLHWIEKEGGELKHTEFPAYLGGDPRRALVEALCRDIPLGVCTTAYNMTFEKTRLKELASIYPDLIDQLLDIHGRLVNLMIPFPEEVVLHESHEGIVLHKVRTSRTLS